MNALELKVLLIEDNPGDAFLVKFYLNENADPIFHVSHADTLSGGLKFLEENKYDLVLSDMNLPDSSGMDTIKSIMSKYPGNLVMVLTGLSDEEVGLETVRYGAQDFLVKGKFDGKVLVSTVMFAFERFKLNKKLDSVSKQLSEENDRFDSLQRLLNVGFIEFDLETKEAYLSSTALNHLGNPECSENVQLNEIGQNIENYSSFKEQFTSGQPASGKSSTVIKRSDTQQQIKIEYEITNGKVLGVVSLV